MRARLFKNGRQGSGIPAPGSPTGGFTLIEVILAIGIAIGILVVAFYFYSQTAELRTQLLAESERVSAVRLVMDRLTADLRCAYGTFSSGSGVSGDVGSLKIVKTELPSRGAWSGGQLGRAVTVETDLKLVSYSVSSSLEGTNQVVTGLIRAEEPLVQKRPQVIEARRANQVAVQVEPENQRGPEPLTDAIRFVQFRYWDGSNWRESWSGTELPRGIEVSLGGESLPEGSTAEDYPYEVFRRVIYLPGSQVNPGSTGTADFMDEDAFFQEVSP